MLAIRQQYRFPGSADYESVSGNTTIGAMCQTYYECSHE